jgi:hypothetical protein
MLLDVINAQLAIEDHEFRVQAYLLERRALAAQRVGRTSPAQFIKQIMRPIIQWIKFGWHWIKSYVSRMSLKIMRIALEKADYTA